MSGTFPGLIGAGPLFDADAALADRLKLVFPVTQFQHDVMPGKLDRAAWEKLALRAPFIGRVWTGWPNGRPGTRIFSGRATWQVYLIAGNPRSEPLFRGDTFGIGLFAMAQVALAAVNGWTVTNLGTWEAGGAQNSVTEEWQAADKGLVVLDASIGLELVDGAAFAQLDEFLRLGVTWSAPPIDEQVQTVRAA